MIEVAEPVVPLVVVPMQDHVAFDFYRTQEGFGHEEMDVRVLGPPPTGFEHDPEVAPPIHRRAQLPGPAHPRAWAAASPYFASSADFVQTFPTEDRAPLHHLFPTKFNPLDVLLYHPIMPVVCLGPCIINCSFNFGPSTTSPARVKHESFKLPTVPDFLIHQMTNESGTVPRLQRRLGHDRGSVFPNRADTKLSDVGMQVKQAPLGSAEMSRLSVVPGFDCHDITSLWNNHPSATEKIGPKIMVPNAFFRSNFPSLVLLTPRRKKTTIITPTHCR